MPERIIAEVCQLEEQMFYEEVVDDCVAIECELRRFEEKYAFSDEY